MNFHCLRILITAFGMIYLPTFIISQTNQATIDSIQRHYNSSTGKTHLIDQIHLAAWWIDDPTKIDNANRMINEALVVFKQNKDSSLIAESNKFKGSYHYVKLHFDSALQFYLLALPYYERTDNKKQVRYISSQIGGLYLDTRNYQKALAYYKSSLAKSKEMNIPNLIADELCEVGGAYYYMDSAKSALLCYQGAYTIYKIQNNKEACATLENNMASVYNDLKEYDKALDMYRKSMTYFLAFSDSINYAMCLANIGNIYNNMNQPKEGIPYILKSLAISERYKNSLINTANYDFLQEGYSKMGDFKNAFFYARKLHSIDSATYNEESNQNIADMQAKYDSEQKEKENKILKQENEIKTLSNTRQSFLIYAASGGLVIALLAAFFIFRGYRHKQKVNLALEQKNGIIEEKNKDILDSIRYAQRLQEAILPTANFEREFKNNAFLFYKPKDIVSGDFYWMEKKDNTIFIAAVDCTGHGVPGAFMSIVGYNLLNRAVNENHITQPALILDSLNTGVTEALRQDEVDSIVQDGMDIALCSVNYDTLELQYAGAYNPIWIVRNGELIEMKPNKFPVGAFLGTKLNLFTNHKIALQQGDLIYLFTDGFADQFGGDQGKKFKYKPFGEKLIEISGKKMSDQKNILESTMQTWQGNLEQVDDVLVIGIRI